MIVLIPNHCLSIYFTSLIFCGTLLNEMTPRFHNVVWVVGCCDGAG